MQPKVTICPPGAAHGSDEGQLCQFDKRKHTVTKDNGIAFADMDRMHVKRTGGIKGSKQNPIPRWVHDDVLMRKVIIAYLENTVVNGSRRPQLHTDLPDAERLKAVREQSKEMIFPLRCQLVGMVNRYSRLVVAGVPQKTINSLAEQIQNVDSRITCLERGLDVVATSACYLSYRLNYTSVQVAEELKLKPPHVRQILNRLNHAWTKISGEYPESKYAPGGKWFRRPTRTWPVWKRQLLFILRAQGRTFREINKIMKLGGPRNCGSGVARDAYKRYFCQAVDCELEPGTRVIKMERLGGGRRIVYRLLSPLEMRLM